MTYRLVTKTESYHRQTRQTQTTQLLTRALSCHSAKLCAQPDSLPYVLNDVWFASAHYVKLKLDKEFIMALKTNRKSCQQDKLHGAITVDLPENTVTVYLELSFPLSAP